MILLSNAINLLLLVMSGSPLGKTPPIIDVANETSMVDPLPQALILTAIVIGFGMVAFLITLVYQSQSRRHDAPGK